MLRRTTRRQTSANFDEDQAPRLSMAPPPTAQFAEIEEEDELQMQLDESSSPYERELDSTGATAVSRGRLHIQLHTARRSATYWFELLHASKSLNYYSSNSNHKNSFVGSISLHSASIIPCAPAPQSSAPQSFIITLGGARQTAPIHHTVSPPSDSALSFWLDALTAVTDSCLSRDAVELRRRKAVLLQQLHGMRQQRPSLQLIGASLQDSSIPSASLASPPPYTATMQHPSPSLLASAQQPQPSSSTAAPSLFVEEGDGGEAFRECSSHVRRKTLV
jgi:hypothetical protein